MLFFSLLNWGRGLIKADTTQWPPGEGSAASAPLPSPEKQRVIWWPCWGQAVGGGGRNYMRVAQPFLLFWIWPHPPTLHAAGCGSREPAFLLRTSKVHVLFSCQVLEVHFATDQSSLLSSWYCSHLFDSCVVLSWFGNWKRAKGYH